MGAIPEAAFKNVQYALRGLRRSPGFAVTAVLTLALGIGASTAVFTAVDSIVVKPLPYPDSGRLVVVWERVRFLGPEPTGANARHFDIWRTRATSFAGMALVRQGAAGLSAGGDHPSLVGTVTCSPSLFDVLAVAPAMGRGFTPEDAIKGRDKIAILAYPVWRDVFNGDPNVIGRTIRLADIPRQVIGVMPATFHFPNRNALRSFHSAQSAASVPEPAVFIPAVIDQGSQYGWNSDYGNWVALARLKPRAGIGAADAELNALQAQIVREMPANQRDDRPGALAASVQPMREAVAGDFRTALLFLMAAVLGLVLIACVNLANAQLGRAIARHRDAAVRVALGAARWRLVWEALTESILVALMGGAAGMGLAAAALSLFRRYHPVDLPRLSELHLNAGVLLFAAALTVGSSLLLAALPALRLARADPQAFLQQGNRTLGSHRNRGLRAFLVGAQVFGCTVLLLATGLFSKSLLHLMNQQKGFETGRVALAQVNLPAQTYDADSSRIAFIDGVLANLRAIPGVRDAGLISAMPLEGETWIEYMHRVDRPRDETPLINLRWASPGYFEATGQRLVAGRFLEERDRDLNSVVLSESEAKALWKDADPIGGQVETEGRRFTVIGVVADSRNASLKTLPPKAAYLHYRDRPPYLTVFMARGAQAADSLVGDVRQAIWKYAPGVAITQAKSLDAQMDQSVAAERFQTRVLTGFGAAALLLAMLGIYGVLSYSVAARRQEIGVRMALGATRGRIYALAAGQALAPVVAGLAAGLGAGIFAGRAAQKLLFGVRTVDPSVMLIVAALFLIAAAGAAFVPARRAARVDPIQALRQE